VQSATIIKTVSGSIDFYNSSQKSKHNLVKIKQLFFAPISMLGQIC